MGARRKNVTLRKIYIQRVTVSNVDQTVKVIYTSIISFKISKMTAFIQKSVDFGNQFVPVPKDIEKESLEYNTVQMF